MFAACPTSAIRMLKQSKKRVLSFEKPAWRCVLGLEGPCFEGEQGKPQMWGVRRKGIDPLEREAHPRIGTVDGFQAGGSVSEWGAPFGWLGNQKEFNQLCGSFC